MHTRTHHQADLAPTDHTIWPSWSQLLRCLAEKPLSAAGGPSIPRPAVCLMLDSMQPMHLRLGHAVSVQRTRTSRYDADEVEDDTPEEERARNRAALRAELAQKKLRQRGTGGGSGCGESGEGGWDDGVGRTSTGKGKGRRGPGPRDLRLGGCERKRGAIANWVGVWPTALGGRCNIMQHRCSLSRLSNAGVGEAGCVEPLLPFVLVYKLRICQVLPGRQLGLGLWTRPSACVCVCVCAMPCR